MQPTSPDRVYVAGLQGHLVLHMHFLSLIYRRALTLQQYALLFAAFFPKLRRQL